MSYLIENIIESVKSRSFAPISQTTFQDADIIAILDEELKLKLVADLLSIREDFFLYRKLVPMLSNKQLYFIPTRAIGNAVKAIFPVDAAGVTGQPLTKRDIDDLGSFDQATGDPRHFYFEGDQVGLYPYPTTSGGHLLFSYARKPNQLAMTSECAKITAVDSVSVPGTTTFTVDTNLTADLIVGSKIDLLKGESPFGLWADQVAITAISATTISVLTSAVDDVNGTDVVTINDYICPTGYSNIPMIPEEFHPVLAQMGAVRLLASLGHMEKWQTAKAELVELRKEALKLVKNRAESAPDKVYKKNPLLTAFRR